MTIDMLKERIQDRINILESSLANTADHEVGDIRLAEVYLEGRLDESRKILSFVEDLETDERFEHPLLEVTKSNIPWTWGLQLRGDWPSSTFGGVDIDTPSDELDRYDPARC